MMVPGMRWSYKTVHFSLKKEGLLGSAFLDEAEIEISLNEFGQSGWELVSFMEVNDGLIAVFKQPLSGGLPDLTGSESDDEAGRESGAAIAEPAPVRDTVAEELPREQRMESQEVPVQKPPSGDESASEDEEGDVGAIRIF